MKKTAVIMGSDSDIKVVGKALDILRSFDLPFTVHIMSAHRTPDEVSGFARSAAENGYGVIIAAAGKAAHLAGVIASHTPLPVIGIPVSSSDLGGMDALLSTVQMPSGIPVATVAIDGSANAAWLAVRILALEDNELSLALNMRIRVMAEEVKKKNLLLQQQIKKEAE